MKNNNWVLWLIGLGSIAFMSFTLWQNYLYAASLGKDYQGLFGDMFGASNALFTGLSFVGVIIAIRLQSQELKLQRKELELTRNEMELTRDEFAIQNSTMKVQQFENTFFQMISLFQGNTKTMSFNSDGEIYEGAGIFSLLLDGVEKGLDLALRNRFYQNDDKSLKEDDYDYYRYEEFQKVGKEEFIPLFLAYFSIYGDNLTKYFTTLYNTLKLIDKSEIIDKQYYVSIINSQLSRVERLTIFYYTIAKDENSNFRMLVEKYNLLDGLNEGMVISKKIYNEYKPNLENKLLLV
ncbi:MAG: putative phage abortive infection protein [Chryseobacterium sp.]|uniref:putative phage abortive infection protein n=1 Tax=Chryseobacterium sp. TaxID=1871047 RepID=UPI003D095FD5